jgi:sulfur-carrier protein adenylyltransferase/sulfurtransferase
MQFSTVKLRKDPSCPACGTRTIRELIDYDEYCGTVGGEAPYDHNGVAEITPRELAAQLCGGANVDVIDVREPGEWAISRLPKARLIPLGELPGSMATLDSSRDIVVMCRSGQRSASAVRQLQAAGFKKVKNLAGGILRWSDEVDPSVQKY